MYSLYVGSSDPQSHFDWSDIQTCAAGSIKTGLRFCANREAAQVSRQYVHMHSEKHHALAVRLNEQVSCRKVAVPVPDNYTWQDLLNHVPENCIQVPKPCLAHVHTQISGVCDAQQSP